MKICLRGILDGWDLREDKEKVLISGRSWVTEWVRCEQCVRAQEWWELCDGASQK
jgi:hypothetical protein